MIRARTHRPLGAAEPPQSGGLGLIYLLGGISLAWAAWALLTPHQELPRKRR